MLIVSSQTYAWSLPDVFNKFGKTDECQGKSDKNLNICSLLKEAATKMQKNLPLVISANVSMIKMYSIGNTLVSEVEFGIDSKSLAERLIKAGISDSQYKESLVKLMKSSACQDESSVYLIKNGGIFNTVYKFNDDTVYYTFDISNC